MIDHVYLTAAAIASLVGFAKCGVPGVGILAVPLMAIALGDARMAVGVLLPALITGDCFALAYYRRHAEWVMMLGLIPWVAAGIGVGWLALRTIDDAMFGPLVGTLIIALIILDAFRRWRNWRALPHHPVFGALIGLGAGFATTVAGAAGPLMVIYLLCHGFEKERFIGSLAWYFLIVNVTKIPIYLIEDMITSETLRLNVVMIPAVALGAIAGRWLLAHMPPKMFERVVLTLTIVAAVRLLVL